MVMCGVKNNHFHLSLHVSAGLHEYFDVTRSYDYLLFLIFRIKYHAIHIEAYYCQIACRMILLD